MSGAGIRAAFHVSTNSIATSPRAARTGLSMLTVVHGAIECRLVVHGFFADIIRKVGVPEIEKRLLEAVEAELAINIGLPS